MLVCWYNHIINTYINAPQSSRPRLHVPYISIASLCGDKLDKWYLYWEDGFSFSCRSTKILGLTLPHISDEELANRVDAVVSYFREAKSIRLQEVGLEDVNQSCLQDLERKEEETHRCRRVVRRRALRYQRVYSGVAEDFSGDTTEEEEVKSVRRDHGRAKGNEFERKYSGYPKVGLDSDRSALC